MSSPTSNLITTLSDPISRSIRATRALAIGGTLGTAAAMLRVNGTVMLPVVEDGRLVGAVTEASLLAAQANGADLEADVSLAVTQPLTLSAKLTGAQALRELSEHPDQLGAVVVDGDGRLLGLLFPSDLFPKPRLRLKPPSIGGMATPFGVYLTSGSVQSGPPWWGLAATGALLATFLTAARLIMVAITMRIPVGHLWGHHPTAVELELFRDLSSLVLFAIFLQLAPLSRIHAAEHMVVHAIERDEPLTPEVVARMPRVHPRCGTNIAVTVFLLTLCTIDWGLPEDLQAIQLILGVFIALGLRQPAGAIAQLYVTTRTPKRKHILLGIKSGEELLEKYAKAPVQSTTFLQRLWSSGIAYTALGGMLTGWLYALIATAVHHPEWLSP